MIVLWVPSCVNTRVLSTVNYARMAPLSFVLAAGCVLVVSAWAVIGASGMRPVPAMIARAAARVAIACARLMCSPLCMI